MDREQLYQKIKEIVEGEKTHPHYQRTIDVAKLARQIMTGEDQAELIVSYKPRETKEQKTQRIALYNSRTKSVSAKLLSQYKEVERSDNTVDNIWYSEESPEGNDKLKALKERMKNYDGTSFQKYLHDAKRRLNFYDPNTWIVTEFRYLDDLDYPWPYPLEVYSHQAVYWEYLHGDLQYFVGRWAIEVKDQPEKGWKYTIYGKNMSIRLTEIGRADKNPTSDLDTVTLTIGQIEKVFTIEFFESKFEKVPAIRVGYKKDDKTSWRTYVTPYDPAMHIFKDMINTKSEYDLHKALHGFIQKFAYVDKCVYRPQDNMADVCNGGTLRMSNVQCPQCKGVGTKIHTTVQDIILIQKPEDVAERIPLDQMVHYVEIPKHIIDGHKEDLQQLEKDVSLAIFNANIFDRSEIAMTATEKRLNLQSVYNELSEYGESFSTFYEFMVFIAANTIDGQKGLIVEHSIPKDFRLDTVQELLQQKKLAIDSSSSYDIIQAIDLAILMKQNQDNPEFIEQVKAQEKFRPFKDKSKEEIVYLLASFDDSHPDKVLYIFFDKIFTDIWFELPQFHDMKYPVQKVKVMQKVLAIIEENNIIKNGGVNPSDSRTALSTNIDVEAEARAKLKGTVGGVQGIIDISSSVASGIMTETAAIAILKFIYGFDDAAAKSMIDVPDASVRAKEVQATGGATI